jgi:hydrogenase small subunit
MALDETLGDHLLRRGISRRGFMKFCTAMASAMAMPPSFAKDMAQNMAEARRQSVIWLSFQECTGCTESLTRSHHPTLENLIFDFISLDYHHTLQAASGHAAEQAREQAMERAGEGGYLVVVDGSIPTAEGGVYSTIAGKTNLQMLQETVSGAAAVISVGSCASFGGIPGANPNPTGAVSVADLMEAGQVASKPVINVSGCPPVPMVITGVLAQFLTFGTLPKLDEYGRPRAFFGQSIHDRCYRRPFYDKGLFAETFDDAGAKAGWCLYRLGCKGPMTYNACATMKWNSGASWPVEAGYPCLGCSEPEFWDAGSFYNALSVPTGTPGEVLLGAGAVGAAVGVGAGVMSRHTRKQASEHHSQVSADQLEEKL